MEEMRQAGMIATEVVTAHESEISGSHKLLPRSYTREAPTTSAATSHAQDEGVMGNILSAATHGMVGHWERDNR